MSSMTPSEVKDLTTIIKRRMNDAGLYPETIKVLLSTYDLNSFISTTTLSFTQLAEHFVTHGKAVQRVLFEWNGEGI